MEKIDWSKYIASGFFPDGRPIPGTAREMAMRMREAERRKTEKLIDDLSEDFPALKRIYDFVKSDSDAGGGEVL